MVFQWAEGLCVCAFVQPASGGIISKEGKASLHEWFVVVVLNVSPYFGNMIVVVGSSHPARKSTCLLPLRTTSHTILCTYMLIPSSWYVDKIPICPWLYLNGPTCCNAIGNWCYNGSVNIISEDSGQRFVDAMNRIKLFWRVNAGRNDVLFFQRFGTLQSFCCTIFFLRRTTKICSPYETFKPRITNEC